MTQDENPDIAAQQKEVEDRLLAKMTEKHGDADGYRRFKLIQETVPLIGQWVIDNQDKLGEHRLHPEHLEMYIQHLLPKVGGIVENVAEVLIKKFESAPTMNHRIAMMVKCVTIMDQKSIAVREAPEED